MADAIVRVKLEPEVSGRQKALLKMSPQIGADRRDALLNALMSTVRIDDVMIARLADGHEYDFRLTYETKRFKEPLTEKLINDWLRTAAAPLSIGWFTPHLTLASVYVLHLKFRLRQWHIDRLRGITCIRNVANAEPVYDGYAVLVYIQGEVTASTLVSPVETAVGFKV